MTNINRNQIMVRINGILPDISRVGNIETSERAMEIEKIGEKSTTSCSIINFINDNKILHILVDIGQNNSTPAQGNLSKNINGTFNTSLSNNALMSGNSKEPPFIFHESVN